MDKKSKQPSEEAIPQRAVGYIKPVVFVLALCVTVLVFSLPIVFYYLTSYSVISNHQATVNRLPNASNVVNNSTMPCDSSTILSWGVIEDSVTECEPYTGTICLPYLIQWNQCILPGGGDQEDIHVAVNSNGKTQDILEEELSELNALLANYSNCHSIAIPFLCHHYFPLMAAECQSTTVDDDQLYTVTQEDCINIRDTICAVLWQLDETRSFSDRLPDCQSLPNRNEQMNMTSSPVSNQSVSCRDDFILIDNTCNPRCDRFEDQSHDSTLAIVIAEVFSATVCTLLGVIALILAIYNRKRMFKFPSVFLFLFIGDLSIIAIVVLINAINRTKLNCSSVNLVEALMNPTLFCYISGALHHYSGLNAVIWWFFHLCIFFYEVMFPFHAHRMRELGRLKKLFVLLLVSGFLIPVPGVIAGLTSRKHHYNLGSRFPPSVCLPSAELWFYFTGFPLTVLLCIGTCLLIIVVWKIDKQKAIAMKYERHQAKKSFTVAEKKLMIVSILFIIYGSYLMMHFGITTGGADSGLEALTNYFLCESTGHVPGKCDSLRKDIESTIIPELSILTFILLGTLPLTVLNFIVNWGALWKSMMRSVRSFITIDHEKSHSTSNATHQP